MAQKEPNLAYGVKHESEMSEKLAEHDVFITNQTYQGSGLADFFGTPQDITLVRLGRVDFEDHKSTKFSRRGNSLADMVTPTTDYSVFLPITIKNVDQIIARGEEIDYFTAGIQEGSDGWISGLAPGSRESYSSDVREMAKSMPKKIIPEVTKTDIIVGKKVYEGVLSSNPGDDGRVSIQSVTKGSSMFYNPRNSSFEPFIPCWGSFGWRKPARVVVEGDKLYVDEREGTQGELYRIDFTDKGYNPVQVK